MKREWEYNIDVSSGPVMVRDHGGSNAHFFETEVERTLGNTTEFGGF